MWIYHNIFPSPQGIRGERYKMAKINMEMDLFSKELTSKDGKKFRKYFGALNGHPINVKFTEKAGNPTKTPCHLTLKEANCVSKEYTTSDGTTGINKTVWVSDYIESEYVDTSMDDFNTPPTEEDIPFN